MNDPAIYHLGAFPGLWEKVTQKAYNRNQRDFIWAGGDKVGFWVDKSGKAMRKRIRLYDGTIVYYTRIEAKMGEVPRH